MMSVLEELWYGNIAPSERTIRKNSEYARLSKETLHCEEQFINELSAEGRKFYEDRISKLLLKSGIEECDSFICGFRLGAKVMLEVLEKQDSQLPQISSW